MNQNPKLKAIVQIRNLVLGLSNDWTDLKSLGASIDEAVNEANDTFIDKTPIVHHEGWTLLMTEMQENVNALKGIMSKSAGKINSKDSEGLVELWDSHKEYSSNLLENLNSLFNLGKEKLPKSEITSWEGKWNTVFDTFLEIQNVVEGSSLHLTLISEFAPDEVDELTDTILRNMPKRYTMEEALQYEKEYMEAYEELKKEATQKKNLWDKFLDILAGGFQQSPAERVMMQRWVNGEKGDL